MKIEHTLVTSRAEVERLSLEDALTGLANRRAFDAALTLHWNYAARKRADLGLLVVDLDHFKAINDTHGHAAGDACLKHVAALMRGQFRRASDTVARVGGEEFAVLLPDANAEQAQMLARKLCTALAGSPFQYEQRSIAVTASIGAGAMQWDVDRNPPMSFSRIDAACYAAKAQGRNRVVLA